MKSMKTVNRILLLSAATLWLVCFSSCSTTGNTAKAKETPHASVKKARTNAGLYHSLAKAVTDQCPIKINETVDLIAFAYNEDQNELVYTYQLPGNAAEMDERQIAIAQQTVANMVKEELKGNSSIAQFRSDALILTFAYKDKNGKELFTIHLKPGEY